MELPQPRPFGAEGRKSTHDFLSLYSSTQDPRSQVQAGSFLKTHDFLQPLEQQSTKSPTEEDSTLKVTTPEKPLPQAPPPHPPPSGEHVLPGGIGTYSISHISYLNPTTVLKPEGGLFSVARTSSTDHNNEENSNCSSYTGSGFTLWEESAAKKGKTGKENVVADRHVTRGPSAQKRQFNGQLKIDRMAEVGVKSGGGPWQTSDRPSPSSTNTTATTTINHRNATAAFSSLSSSQPQPYHRNQSFMDMLKSAKVNHEEDDDEEDGFVLKKEASPQLRGDLTVKVGSASGSGKSNDQKPNTPRSKHSATEQRRRSKINDRFHMLRELIPHSDQKRDKASFLLEVIEYIHYLQEKVHKHEGSFQGWNQEPPKLMPWANSHRPSEGFVNQARATNCGSGPGLMFPANFEEKNIDHSPSYPRNGQNALEPDMSSMPSLKAVDHHSGLAKRAVLLPVPLQPNVFTSRECGGGAVAQPSARLASDVVNMACQPQSHWPTTNDSDVNTKLKEHEMNIESGTISISSAYSQGLLNTLTRALQSSGVDLSQASVSVQIDLGKRANGRQSASTSLVKGNDIHSSNPTVGCSRGASSGDDSDQALKKRKTC